MHPRAEYWGFRHGDSRMISVQFHASSVNISEIRGARGAADARRVRNVYLHKLLGNQTERGGEGGKGHMSPMHLSRDDKSDGKYRLRRN